MTFELCSLEGPEAGWVKAGQWRWERGLGNSGLGRLTRERKTEPLQAAGGTLSRDTGNDHLLSEKIELFLPTPVPPAEDGATRTSCQEACGMRMGDGAGEGVLRAREEGVLRARSGDQCTGMRQANAGEGWGETASWGRGDRT